MTAAAVTAATMAAAGALAVGALLAAAAVLGRALTAAAAGPDGEPGDDRGWGWAADTLGGLAALHLALLALDAAGVRWTRVTIAAAWLLPAAGAAALAWRRGVGAERLRFRWGRLGWGDWTAAATVALYAGFAWTGWITIPDFVYHWGAKGRRYHLAGGVDWAFLADPLRLAHHPDYPNLLPDLFAAAATLAGRFDERAQMLWSAALFALLLPAARAAWRRLGTAPAARQVGIVLVAAAAAMFGIGYRLAGGGEWNLAVALAAALPVLAAPAVRAGSAAAARADGLRLGYAAAFAAASKLEGVALAAIVVALHLGRRARAGGLRELGRAALPAALPAVLVTAPWLAANLCHGLISANHPRAFDLGRAAEVLPAVATALGTREWHGLAWLLPPLALALALARRTRPIGLACAALLGFYLWVYLASPLEPRFYVLSSLPRLLFHLAPAALVGAVALLGGYKLSGNPSVSASPQKFSGSLL